jgi:hypothetical protein
VKQDGGRLRKNEAGWGRKRKDEEAWRLERFSKTVRTKE